MRRWLLLAPFLVACPPTNIVDDLPFDAQPSFDATTDAGPVFSDATIDVGADVPVFNGGGPFLCSGCVCDGTLNFCYPSDASTGDADAEAGACGDASTSCDPIPVQCLPKPTCACLLGVWTSCTCAIDPSGNGLVLDCP